MRAETALMKRHSNMPMVKKATRNVTCAVWAMAFATLGGPVLSEDHSPHSLIKSEHGLLESTFRGADDFQLSFGREVGPVVLGGILSSESSGPLARAVDADEARQFRLQAGYNFGQAIGYVTLGGVQASRASGRSEGQLWGLGMRVSLNRALQLSGELLHHDAVPAEGAASSSGETLSVKAAFRF